MKGTKLEITSAKNEIPTDEHDELNGYFQKLDGHKQKKLTSSLSTHGEKGSSVVIIIIIITIKLMLRVQSPFHFPLFFSLLHISKLRSNKTDFPDVSKPDCPAHTPAPS